MSKRPATRGQFLADTLTGWYGACGVELCFEVEPGIEDHSTLIQLRLILKLK